MSVEEDVQDTPKSGATPPRYSRRLSDKILVAFHHACDQQELDVAGQLLTVLETLLMQRGSAADLGRRRNMESLVAAHERLWSLRNPSAD
jgi:hypothetical protein